MNTQGIHMKRMQGMTLIEVMIVVTILGIISAFAIPSYREYSTRGQLTEAYAALAMQRVKLEQYFQDNRTYDGACTDGTVAPPIPDTDHFTFACDDLTASTFTLTATGVTGSGTDGFIFSLNEANTRATTAAPTGWTTNASCWVMRKDGSC